MTDPIIAAARFLAGQMEWIRHAADEQGGPYAAGVLDEIERCVRRMRSLVDGPAPKRFLGPCGAELATIAACGPHPEQYVTCAGDVYGIPGGEKGTCRTCGATVDQDERRAWLDEQVAGVAFRAAHIADAYRINVNTIRTWAARGLLVAHSLDRQERPLFLVGDVLELARAAALRRAENEARRHRQGAAA